MAGSNEIIEGILPHREPFLFVTNILEFAPYKKSARLNYQVTGDEEFFKGHFPGNPIMPDNLIVEALSQAGAVVVYLGFSDAENKMGVLAGVDGFRFRKPVRPGDLLILEVEIKQLSGLGGKVYGRATVNDKLVTDGEILFRIVPRDI